MEKKNWILPGVIALVAVVMLVLSPMLMTHTDEDAVIVTVGGIEYARVPLSQPQTVTTGDRRGQRRGDHRPRRGDGIVHLQESAVRPHGRGDAG